MQIPECAKCSFGTSIPPPLRNVNTMLQYNILLIRDDLWCHSISYAPLGTCCSKLPVATFSVLGCPTVRISKERLLLPDQFHLAQLVLVLVRFVATLGECFSGVYKMHRYFCRTHLLVLKVDKA